MSTLGKKVVPPVVEKPEWAPIRDKRGFFQHRDPPHRLRYAPDAWEQAAATLEDNAKSGKFLEEF